MNLFLSSVAFLYQIQNDYKKMKEIRDTVETRQEAYFKDWSSESSLAEKERVRLSKENMYITYENMYM